MIESMPIVMFCEVSGYPPPWVAWIRKGQVLQNKTSGLNYFLGHNATTEDAGNYTCMAGNFAGVTSVDYQLTVRGTYFNLGVKCVKEFLLRFLSLCLHLLMVTLRPYS